MENLPDQDDGFDAAWELVKDHTMTSRERGQALWAAVHTVVDNDIPGCIVECGVWRGGSAMLAALALKSRGAARPIVLFDTFAGMSPPGPEDRDIGGDHAADLMAGKNGAEIAELVQAEAPLDQVRAAMESTGYDMRLVRFVEGDVCETLPRTQTLEIALLRLDTDFYDSTYAELTHLYPRLAQGGLMIVDDYGHWQGARKAFEDYFAQPNLPYRRPMLWTIDYTGRGAVKTEPSGDIEIERYDYMPPGMDPPSLSHLFPHAEAGNPWNVRWDYLRSSAPHVWRFDDRHKGYVTGNASVEEAACLYTFARQFAGKRGLEIGTYYGWTAAHLLAAGLRLDCVDPAFADPKVEFDVRAALDRVPGSQGYHMWPDPSPDCIDRVREADPEPWSFAFIDGNHDGDAPRLDAEATLPHLAADAMVMFHDMLSPHVAAGFEVFRAAGFETALVNTMQIMGVAWRGNVVPPVHVPDPNVPPVWASHLVDISFAPARAP